MKMTSHMTGYSFIRLSLQEFTADHLVNQRHQSVRMFVFLIRQKRHEMQDSDHVRGAGAILWNTIL